MAKRTAALVAALVMWTGTAAGASPPPLWPCQVPVWIEPGPIYEAAVVAVGQLDDATAIAWPIVENRDQAMVTVRVESTPLGTHANVAATETEKVWGEVLVDLPTTPKRLYLTGLLHEFGHVAGLDHNTDERSVMNVGEVPWRKYQPVDVGRLGEVECSAA